MKQTRSYDQYFSLRNKATLRCFVIAAITVLLMLLPLSCLAAVEISATLNPTAFSTTEPATLTVTVSGQQSAELELPEVDGLVFHRRGQSSQFQMVNGAVSSSVTISYLVQGIRPGTYTIPPISTMINGETYSSDPIRCTVTSHQQLPRQHQTRPPNENADSTVDMTGDLAFIEIASQKTTAYLGEIIPATIKAYFRKGVKVNLNTLPVLKSDGVLLDSLSDQPRQQDQLVGNTAYTVLIWETALTGIKEGSHRLQIEADATLLIPSRQRQRLPGFGGSIFDDDFFNSVIGGLDRRPVKLISPQIDLTLSPLPAEGQPDGFSGAIGSYRLDVTAQPVQIELGEPVTLKLTVSGSGNFDTVTSPTILDTAGIKTYSPASTFVQESEPHQGRKTFEQAVIISDAGIRQISPVAFSYFDPQQKSYKTLFSDPISLKISPPQNKQPVQPSYTSDQNQVVSASPLQEAPLPHLAPVKLDVRTFAAVIAPPFMKSWFIAVSLVGLSALLSITALRIRKRFLANRPFIKRQQHITQIRRNTLNTLDSIADSDCKSYLIACQQAVREFLSVVWNTTAAAITTRDIRKRLGTDSAVTRLFILADQAMYGELACSKREQAELHQSIVTIISSEL